MKRTSAKKSRHLPGVVVVLLLSLLVTNSSLMLAQRDMGLTGKLNSGAPSIRFTPSPITLGWGGTGYVDVVVENIENLYAAQIRISFPNTLVQVQDAFPGVPDTQIRDGNVFDGFQWYTILNSADNGTGRIEYIVSIANSPIGFTGSGVIATLPLQSIAVGDAVVSFIDVILCQKDGTVISVDWGIGQTDITTLVDTSTPTSTTVPGGTWTPTATGVATATSTHTPTVTPTPSRTATSDPSITASITATRTQTPVPTSTRTTAPPASILVVPDVQQLYAEDTTIVQVQVHDVADLYGFTVRLDYNGTVLDIQDAEPLSAPVQVYMGDVFDSFPGQYQITQNQVYDDGIFGQVRFTAYVNSGVPLGFGGDGVLFWIIFRGVNSGLSYITLSEVTIVNHSGTDISRTLSHGQIEILPPEPTTVPSATITRTPTATRTLTPTLTRTRTSTVTATSTRTVTLTPTVTTTLTPTVTVTPTTTRTPTVTVTGTQATPTQTLTPTITLTPTDTIVPTLPPPPTITPTSTITLTPSRTPTVTETMAFSTPTPVCSNYILNGGFETLSESEALPWIRTENISYTGTEWHSGSRSAWLGGYDGASERLYQQVAIPSYEEPDQHVTEVVLGYWWAIATEEETHPFDFMYVRIRNTADQQLAVLETLHDGMASETWQYSEFDLSAYEGQTIRISFEASTDGSNWTTFFLDDVELIICEILQPTPTATQSPTATNSPTATATGVPTLTPTISPTPVVQEFQNKDGIYSGCEDSWLDFWYPSYPEGAYGAEGTLKIRSSGIRRPVFKFNISSLPSGVTVLDARLWVNTDHYKSNEQVMTAEAYGLKRDWNEMQVTWNAAKTGAPWSQGGADNATAGPDADRFAEMSDSKRLVTPSTWYDFDVTSLAQAWIDGTQENYGIILIGTGNTVEMNIWSSEYKIEDWRPKLVVEYIYGTLPPATLTPSPTAGPSLTPSATATPGGSQIILQQQYLGYVGVDDTYISEWNPTDNFGGSIKLSIREGGIRSTLVMFDLSSLPAGVTIESARLELYATSRSNAGTTSVGVHSVLRPWAEHQANWSLATAGDSWSWAGCSHPGVDFAADATDTQTINGIEMWHSWDVTALVSQWYTSPSSNNGMVLRATGTTDVQYDYTSADTWWAYDKSPRLILTVN